MFMDICRTQPVAIVFCLIIFAVIVSFVAVYSEYLWQKYYQKIKKWTQVVYLLVKILRFGCVIKVEMDELSVGKTKDDDEIIKFGGIGWIVLWWRNETSSHELLIRIVEKSPPPIVVDFGEKWRTIVLVPNEK